MIYFIADMHLGHEKMLDIRPFESVEEMDETLVRNWNKKVGTRDTVYVIGDMLWKDGAKYLKRLKGKKVLVVGNHDNVILNDEEAKAEFIRIDKLIEDSFDNHPVTLCHYPMVEWKNSRKVGSSRLGYLIHGHIHLKYDDIMYQVLMSNPNALNAGVEVNNYEPVSFSELYENNMKYKERVLRPEFLSILKEREALLK